MYSLTATEAVVVQEGSVKVANSLCDISLSQVVKLMGCDSHIAAHIMNLLIIGGVATLNEELTWGGASNDPDSRVYKIDGAKCFSFINRLNEKRRNRYVEAEDKDHIQLLRLYLDHKLRVPPVDDLKFFVMCVLQPDLNMQQAKLQPVLPQFHRLYVARLKLLDMTFECRTPRPTPQLVCYIYSGQQ